MLLHDKAMGIMPGTTERALRPAPLIWSRRGNIAARVEAKKEEDAMLNIIAPTTRDDFIKCTMTADEYSRFRQSMENADHGTRKKFESACLPSPDADDTAIQDYAIIPMGDKRFVFRRTDLPRIGGRQKQAMRMLAEQEPDGPELHNPIWASVGEDGTINIE